uniref:ZP domain-containing protein n=1 Tax=Monopterus albus TaxID=43700 RepID=A0A3Q3JG31_MONAL|nr:uncharacterized protein LOC109962653 [Monopterus albus]
METCLYIGLVIWAGFAATVAANADIQVVCGNDSVSVIWKISAELVPYASRLFLGSCMPSYLNQLPSGEGEAQFSYRFADCKFKKLVKRKYIAHKSYLTYRPDARPKPPAFVYPIKCVHERHEQGGSPLLNPAMGMSESQGGLVFHMMLLNEQLTGVAETNVVSLGSFMPIWAVVEQIYHQPLLLLMEKCVVASTPQLQPDSQVYPIIGNKGCLLESKNSNSVFLPRYHSSSLILYLQAFNFPLGEVYIHCKLVAWNPDALDESKKVCHYVKETSSWSLLDDPFQSSLCSCCDSTCKSRSRREADWESHSLSYNSVLGPLVIVGPV